MATVIDLSGCSCCTQNTVLSPCNGPDRVRKILTLTINFGFRPNSQTVQMPLTWTTGTAACQGGDVWLWSGNEPVCANGSSPTFNIIGAELCCDGAGWRFGIAVLINGIQDSFQSPFNLYPVSAYTTSPMHLYTQTQATYGLCGQTNFILIDIA